MLLKRHRWTCHSSPLKKPYTSLLRKSHLGRLRKANLPRSQTPRNLPRLLRKSQPNQSHLRSRLNPHIQHSLRPSQRQHRFQSRNLKPSQHPSQSLLRNLSISHSLSLLCTPTQQRNQLSRSEQLTQCLPQNQSLSSRNLERELQGFLRRLPRNPNHRLLLSLLQR